MIHCPLCLRPMIAAGNACQDCYDALQRLPTEQRMSLSLRVCEVDETARMRRSLESLATEFRKLIGMSRDTMPWRAN